MTGPRRRNVQFRRTLRQTWSGTQANPALVPTTKSAWYTANGLENLKTTQGHQVSKLGRANDIGGPFEVVRHIYSESPLNIFVHSNNGAWGNTTEHYKGPIYPKFANVGYADFPTFTPMSDNEMDVKGTKAIGICAPTSPVWNLAQFIGEAREGFPALTGVNFFRERASLARGAGKEYLNHQFGWLPLVNDVRKAAHVIRDSHEIMKWYENQSGKWRKTSWTFPQEDSYTEVTHVNESATPTFPTYFYVGPGGAFGTLTSGRQVMKRCWFEGEFAYYLPPLSEGFSRHASQANKLLGARLTPELLWNLTPWTWMADWFVNTGDVLKNIGLFANDGLVMRRAYVMSSTTITDSHSHYGLRYKTNTDPGACSQTLTTVNKKRRFATPFGFGLTREDLTPRQIAIAVALGLTLL